MAKAADRKVNVDAKDRVAATEKPRGRMFEKLFARKNSEIAVVKNKPGASQAAQKPTVDPIHLQETLVSPRKSRGGKPEVTTPSKLRNHDKNRKPKDSREGILRAVLFGLLFWVVGLGIFENWKSKVPKIDPKAAVSDMAALQAARDRVAFHRQEVGRKVNRERIDVEIQNVKTAPFLPLDARPTQNRDMMEGLPLAVEQTHRPSSRDRLEAPNPDFSDTRVMYNLREQQGANFANDNSREQYIKDFVANAARAGYKVRVDEHGIVHVLGRGAPVRNPAAGSPGSSGIPNMAQ